MMKVLASVYACSPYDGSERAVGWNWIRELDKDNEITAITSHVYKKDIENFLDRNPGVIRNTTFVYVDVPHTKWHVGYRLERLYYILWQKVAFRKAKELCSQETYDLVHHITYVTCILPTYMHKLNIPFLYGPVSGGENTPAIIGYPMSKKDRIVEFVRSASQMFFKSTFNFSITMKKAKLILVTTDETKRLIPAKYHEKVKIFQSIGLNEDIFYPEPPVKKNDRIHFLVAGRMLYWKGFELAIRAFLKAFQSNPDIELTVLGDTENNHSYEMYKEYLKKICGNAFEKNVHFVSAVPHGEMKEFYDRFDCLLNCSLRDSGCFVVMEGMSRRLPLICVNTGGPKVNTTVESAIKIEPVPMAEMIEQVAEAILKIAEDKELRDKMGKAAREHALETFLISSRTMQMNKFYAEVVDKENG